MPNRLAKVDVAGVQRTVNIGLLDATAAAPCGDWVLIHVGFALSKVDEAGGRGDAVAAQGMGADFETELEELKASIIE